MRSDFKHVLRLFGKLTDDHPLNTMVPEDLMHKYCEITIVNDYEETLEAMKVNGSLYRDWEFDEETMKGENVYKLTEQGCRELRAAYNLPDETESKDLSFIQTKIENVIAEIVVSKINENFQNEYIQTLKEISKCYQIKCFNATIALCGKFIEIYLTDLLTSHNIKMEVTYYDRNSRPRTRTELTIKDLIDLTSQLPHKPEEIEINQELLNLIRKYRNGTIHFNDNNADLTDEKVEGIIIFCIDRMKSRLKLT